LRKKGNYGIKYSLASASDEPCPHGWGVTLKMEFSHLRFSILTTGTIESWGINQALHAMHKPQICGLAA